MIDSDESSDGDSNGSDESSAPSSTERSGSRFDEFFDRLEQRESDSNRSSADDESADTTPNEGTDGSRPEGRPAAEDAELEGWVWGSPKEGSERTDEGRSAAADTSSESETERSDPPETGGGRIWHTEADDDLPTGDADSVSSETDSAVPDDETDSVSAERDGSTRTDGPDTARNEAKQASELAAEDRWTEMRSSLRTGARSEQPTGDRSAGTDVPADITASSRDSRDGSDTDSDDDLSWSPAELSTETTAPTGESVDAAVLDGSDLPELDRVTSASGVLVLGPTGDSISEAICSRFLVDDGQSRDVIFVTFEDAPSDRLDVCHRADGWTGGEIGIIEVGRGSRNVSAVSETTGSEATGSIAVRHVSKPNDLSKLGIVITQLLSEFDRTPRQTLLCFHTLSALHAQVGTKTLFRFLNTLQGRLRSAGAVGHYHMDPELHDEIVIETLRPIFDSVVRYSADGDLVVE